VPIRIAHDEAEVRLADVPGWGLAHGKLHRELEFDGFVDAFGFMSMVALLAEAMDHHPEWTNVYRRVVIDLSTHDVEGLSELDFELAAKINHALGEG
jgi:4a-hydroxytetrahydrobiopterin dehydratase